MIDQESTRTKDGIDTGYSSPRQRAIEAYEGARDRAGDTLGQAPLLALAGGIAAGALIAALLPRTRTEDELLGDASDNLWQKAEETARQTVSLVRDAATRVVNRASEAAVEVVDSGRGAARRAVDRAADNAVEAVDSVIEKRSQA